MNSPHVVVKAQYTPSFNNLTYKFNSKEKVKRDVLNMFDYYANEKKKVITMFDYFDGTIGKDKKMNMCFEDGEYISNEDKVKRQKQYCKYIEKSNVYKMIISFPENYLESSINIREFEKKLAKEILPKFFIKCRFVDIKNMSYQFSLHNNTDNLHFHISFCEKKPNFRYKDNSIKYRIKGTFSQRELNFLKNEVEHVIEKEKIFTPLVIKSNKQIDELKKYFRENDQNYILKNIPELEIEEDIMRLGEMLYKERNGKNTRIKYNSINNKEIQQLTNKIKKYVFSKKNPELNSKYQDFKMSIKELNNYFKSISETNNLKNYDFDYSKKKTEYLNNYVFNTIVNHALKEYKTSIHENDVIKEVVYSNYKKEKINKHNILKNYLSMRTPMRYVNRYKINQAVLKINRELEDAEKEFSKLFEEKDYSNTNY